MDKHTLLYAFERVEAALLALRALDDLLGESTNDTANRIGCLTTPILADLHEGHRQLAGLLPATTKEK